MSDGLKFQLESQRHPNLIPPGWREVTEKEFVQSKFFVYSGEQYYLGTLYHATDEDPAIPAFNDRSKEVYHGVKAWLFYDGTGVAIVSDYWKGTLRYFKWGCDHKYKELTKEQAEAAGLVHYGSFWHVNVCQVCGNVDSYDSSG